MPNKDKEWKDGCANNYKNEELKKETRRRFRQQMNLDLETLGLWREYESVEQQLDAALT